MSYWKNKVLPKLKKLLHKGKKSQSEEDRKAFDESKDNFAKEIEDNQEALQPKVVTIYRSSANEAKVLLKEPTKSGVSESPKVVEYLLLELANADCPGARTLSDYTAKHGAVAMSEAIVFLLSKLTIFVAAEEAPPSSKIEEREIDVPATDGDKDVAKTTTTATDEEVLKTKEPVATTTPVSATVEPVNEVPSAAPTS
ncbi:hypothetical protein KP509_01G090100 [Ceratopteris richardii]|uniref:Uncharacterized protein n=1 Tax=Ceratopteris richardii TaxID=49495 RepID=A0A8T2VJ34_CERRI|nr:hypothetical protein KP509_01G090100 [Ceratopteris richardii]